MTALDELRENLREAARRDIEAERVTHPPAKRRATGLLAVVLLGGAAAADREPAHLGRRAGGETRGTSRGPIRQVPPDDRTRVIGR